MNNNSTQVMMNEALDLFYGTSTRAWCFVCYVCNALLCRMPCSAVPLNIIFLSYSSTELEHISKFKIKTKTKPRKVQRLLI